MNFKLRFNKRVRSLTAFGIVCAMLGLFIGMLIIKEVYLFKPYYIHKHLARADQVERNTHYQAVFEYRLMETNE